MSFNDGSYDVSSPRRHLCRCQLWYRVTPVTYSHSFNCAMLFGNAPQKVSSAHDPVSRTKARSLHGHFRCVAPEYTEIMAEPVGAPLW